MRLNRWERGDLWSMKSTKFKGCMKKGIQNRGAGKAGRGVGEVGSLGQTERALMSEFQE